MKRTEVLQGLRQMKFEEVLERTKRRPLSQAEAASMLGMSERTLPEPFGQPVAAVSSGARKRGDFWPRAVYVGAASAAAIRTRA